MILIFKYIFLKESIYIYIYIYFWNIIFTFFLFLSHKSKNIFLYFLIRFLPETNPLNLYCVCSLIYFDIYVWTSILDFLCTNVLEIWAYKRILNSDHMIIFKLPSFYWSGIWIDHNNVHDLFLWFSYFIEYFGDNIFYILYSWPIF